MTVILPESDTDIAWELEELLSKSIPCEYQQFRCHKGGPAKWRARLVPCPGCLRPGFIRAICADCKDYILTTEDAAVCGVCDEVVVPFRHVLKSIDSL